VTEDQDRIERDHVADELARRRLARDAMRQMDREDRSIKAFLIAAALFGLAVIVIIMLVVTRSR
jgi:Flp pilus assembly protein TadB